MSFENKAPVSTSDFEVDPRDTLVERQKRKIRLCNSVRLGLTVLALLSGITILGTSANSIMVYNDTHLPSEYNLPLWPEQFDLRPTVALVAGSAFVVAVNLASAVFGKLKSLRGTVVHNVVIFTTPFIGFVAALVGLTFFFAVNASNSVDTLQSWTCQWSYANMNMQPHFSTLCSQSKTALYLSVILVPVELIALSVAGVELFLERRAYEPTRKTSSPALS
ncbi:hypothetical protein GGR57DRAFT_447326 [Xylariaceae sp. FL1272]|nr:hypothetical protein GGR57DRAFT_447326 [Xylariaceae sp. FL1272]